MSRGEIVLYARNIESSRFVPHLSDNKPYVKWSVLTLFPACSRFVLSSRGHRVERQAGVENFRILTQPKFGVFL